MTNIRITPAYAGKSFSRILAILRFEDHPRLCGEKIRRCFDNKFPKGSPPPMRGKDRLGLGICSGHGITPAYAGKSITIIIFNRYI